ncbi:gp71 [Bacillus phage G]|uniref:Gp71 n=1 Tax=Bacillus phage G TaxID=2884420 RepID=G3MBE1_9CAUD|nr:gp71 [Bacillus phage G]AEO93342.1 gp71 [Bacillus phage G]
MEKIIKHIKSCPMYVYLTFILSHVIITTSFFGIDYYIRQDYSLDNWIDAIIVSLISFTITAVVIVIVKKVKRRKKLKDAYKEKLPPFLRRGK